MPCSVSRQLMIAVFSEQKEEDEGTLAEQPETLMRKQLIAKQQELLGILQHRMELEVADPLPKVDAASHKQADNFSKHQVMPMVY